MIKTVEIRLKSQDGWKKIDPPDPLQEIKMLLANDKDEAQHDIVGKAKY